MYNLYKIEFFTNELDFVSFSAIANPDIKNDYLTLENTMVDIQDVPVEKGYFASITDWSGAIKYQGRVDNVEYTNNVKTVTLVPLLSLFDEDILIQKDSSIEKTIADTINANFVNNIDSLQNLNMRIDRMTTTEASIELKSNICNFYELLVEILTTYNIIVRLSFVNKDFLCEIENITDNITIEADLKNVIDKNIIIGDTYEQLNKIIFVNKDDESQSIAFYLHKDGTISKEDTDRITPVFFKYEYINISSDLETEASEMALTRLTPEKFKNEIIITLPYDSKILPNTIKIGTLVNIINKDMVYQSVLSGYEREGMIVKYVFGYVRSSLTKKLLLESRDKLLVSAKNPVSPIDPSDTDNAIYGNERYSGEMIGVM